MSPIKNRIGSSLLLAKEYEVLRKAVSSGKTSMLEKFLLIEKAAKARSIDFRDTLQLIRLAIKSQTNGDTLFPKIILRLNSIISKLNKANAKPDLSSSGEYVEMGDGLKWATCNLGASKPEQTGDYYAWGETAPHHSSLNPLTWKAGKEAGYWADTYKYALKKEGQNYAYVATKYNKSDGKTVLESADDAARTVLKGNWRIPTEAEWKKLLDKNNFTWTLVNSGNIQGYIVTSKVKGYEGNKIFLPAASDFMNTHLRYKGEEIRGCYWSSSRVPSGSQDFSAYYLSFADSYMGVCGGIRYMGLIIRPVSI